MGRIMDERWRLMDEMIETIKIQPAYEKINHQPFAY